MQIFFPDSAQEKIEKTCGFFPPGKKARPTGQQLLTHHQAQFHSVALCRSNKLLKFAALPAGWLPPEIAGKD